MDRCRQERCTNGTARCLPGICKTSTNNYMNKPSGFSAIGIIRFPFGDTLKALLGGGLDPKMGMRRFWDQEKIIKEYAPCEIEIYPYMQST